MPTETTEPIRAFAPAEAPAGMQHLLNGVIAPRPIAWISTLAADGTTNVAPHSYTTIFSTNPPIVGFVSSGRKDTLNNVEATGDFVYNVAGEDLAEVMNVTSADFPPDVSEFGWTGLTAVPSDLVRSPRVGEAPAALEARLVEVHPIPGANAFLVLGEVVRVHIAARLWDGDRIDLAAFRPVGRTTGSGYARLGDEFKLTRPSYRELLADSAVPAAGAIAGRR
jgi:flavin reductase (DIM6/NTAB) family NADH-FMN oxidoreductase RutF